MKFFTKDRGIFIEENVSSMTKSSSTKDNLLCFLNWQDNIREIKKLPEAVKPKKKKKSMTTVDPKNKAWIELRHEVIKIVKAVVEEA